MVDILNLALPYFGLIFVGFACGKAKSLPESGLAWMNFFLLYVNAFGVVAKQIVLNPPGSSPLRSRCCSGLLRRLSRSPA
jgi:hypothetical protein